MTKENKESKTAKKQPSVDSNEIKDPFDVLTSRMTRKILELEEPLGSLENPEKLLDVYVIGRDIATLMGTLFEIYGPLLKNVGLPINLDEVEQNNDMYRNDLVKKLSQNKGITPLVLDLFRKKSYVTKGAYERHKRFVSSCFDFTKKKRKRT